MKYSVSYCVFLLLAFSARGQKCTDLRNNFSGKQVCSAVDSYVRRSLNPLLPGQQMATLNYVSFIKQLHNKDIVVGYNYDGNWQMVSQSLCMAEDHLGVIEMNKSYLTSRSEKQTRSSDNKQELKGVIFHTYNALIDSCFKQKVVMINEAHDRGQTRAFVLPLLKILKSKGFTHFAMETLYHYNTDTLSTRTGYYTLEPIMGELYREAKRLGMVLIPYEDTNAMSHSNTQRDSVQALNIYNAIKRATSNSKFLILAGYGHISEIGFDNVYYPMAIQFKKLSGIDPYTIDQTTFIEGNPFPSFDIDSILNSRKAESIILKQEGVPVLSNSYDAYVVHPKSNFKDCRPTWLSCKGRRIERRVRCSNSKAVFIQAYYQNEISHEGDFATRIPADQSFYLDHKHFCHLYLIPGNNYIIIFRDQDNNIIGRTVI